MDSTSARRCLSGTLSQILSEAGAPRTFDLLSVDVEGMDLNVLRSIDLTIYRPGLIVVEMDISDLRALDSEIVRYLSEHGYRFSAYAVNNGDFTDERA